VLSANFSFERLRVIPFQKFPGAVNMALDYYYAMSAENHQNPILRFYGWEPYCLSLGKHQAVSEVDVLRLKQDGYHLVRRPTGGSAILHAKELTYSLILPLKDMGHHEIYQHVHQIISNALKKLNYPVELQLSEEKGSYLNRGAQTFACFNRAARAEIRSRGKKLVGSAQRLLGNTLLQHGSILIEQKQLDIINYLETDDMGRKQAREFLTAHSVSLKEIKNDPIDEWTLSEVIVSEWIAHTKHHVFYQYPLKNELTNSKKFVKQFIIESKESKSD